MDCGITSKELGKEMDVHHIIPFRLFDSDEQANKMNNLVSLCPSCHHRDEVRFVKWERSWRSS
jgi:predicted HNH restriction endonuclease